MNEKTLSQQLREAKGWIWWLRYCAAWRLPRWLSMIVQPRVFSDETIRRALSSEVEPLYEGKRHNQAIRALGRHLCPCISYFETVVEAAGIRKLPFPAANPPD
jgi:hypothetical protein